MIIIYFIQLYVFIRINLKLNFLKFNLFQIKKFKTIDTQ